MLAGEGRLVLDAARADEAIAGLERTLSEVRARLRLIRIWQCAPAGQVDDLPDDVGRDVVEAVFADQLAPGRLELAVVEIPKYIEALRRARGEPPPPAGDTTPS
ncbi:hypothetical protein O7608_15810 [Solwaraspora sp. WMMA2056]|uniref:hypothetical protein n=1 Tax=Solwaraspora sp. WMMA2056 TaxID=3015161 RepID=UPI00259AF182|nr:hypothetical protein [Solwaraspora sp. WMMA2056]WJK43976.1 hypothetical protein O7608_15810 [Solwaraspora sp. WMMA2056]